TDTGNFQYSTDNTASNQTSTGTGWLDQDMSTADFSLGFMGQCSLKQLNFYKVLFGNVSCFGDGCGYVSTFADPDTDFILAITNRNQCLKPEPSSAFHYTGNAVDVDNSF